MLFVVLFPSNVLSPVHKSVSEVTQTPLQKCIYLKKKKKTTLKQTLFKVSSAAICPQQSYHILSPSMALQSFNNP